MSYIKGDNIQQYSLLYKTKKTFLIKIVLTVSYLT